MEGIGLLEELKAAWKADREPTCPHCRQTLGELCPSCLLREVGDFLHWEEVQDWCVEWLLSCGEHNALANFIVAAMGQREGLAEDVQRLRTWGEER